MDPHSAPGHMNSGILMQNHDGFPRVDLQSQRLTQQDFPKGVDVNVNSGHTPTNSQVHVHVPHRVEQMLLPHPPPSCPSLTQSVQKPAEVNLNNSQQQPPNKSHVNIPTRVEVPPPPVVIPPPSHPPPGPSKSEVKKPVEINLNSQHPATKSHPDIQQPRVSVERIVMSQPPPGPSQTIVQKRAEESKPIENLNAQSVAPKSHVNLLRRVERMLVPVLEKLSSTPSINKKGSGSKNSILDGTTYHRFLKMMGVVLENNDPEFEHEADLDDEGNVPPELLIPKHQLSDLCAEAAKLKSLGAMEAIPVDKIVELLQLLELNIREGCKVSPLTDPDETEEQSRLWLELTSESIQRGVAASLTALHILTSQSMPKKVYIEDVIDRIVQFTKFQLQNTVYPTFDPVYRVDPKGKGE